MNENENEVDDVIETPEDLKDVASLPHDETKHYDKEEMKSLKVKADDPNISSEEKKRNVKKLAGAISHALRATGEINVRCFGNAAISKGARALAIARRYVEVQGLQLECSPAFITAEMNNSTYTGICFCAFATKLGPDKVDISKIKSILKVKGDPQDISPDDRKRNVKKLAGAIAHALEDSKETTLRCFGAATIGKASKALAIARGYTAIRGSDLYCWPDFIVAEINGSERTGLCWFVYTNETR
jgi:stage V sporulation protein SpoVS